MSTWRITGKKESEAIMQEIIQQVDLAMQQQKCAPEDVVQVGNPTCISEEVTDHSWLHR